MSFSDVAGRVTGKGDCPCGGQDMETQALWGQGMPSPGIWIADPWSLKPTLETKPSPQIVTPTQPARPVLRSPAFWRTSKLLPKSMRTRCPPGPPPASLSHNRQAENTEASPVFTVELLQTPACHSGSTRWKGQSLTPEQQEPGVFSSR